MASKPFLKWAGGKHKLVPFIEHNLPSSARKRLIEPFCGSAALSLALDFEHYLLNDINADVIGLFRILKEEKSGFIDYARSFFNSDNNNDSKFYELREQFNSSKNLHERSALFIYLNRHAFNGLCRYNQKRGYNVPFGRYKTHYFPEKELRFFAEKAQKAEFICADFEQVFNRLQKQPDQYVVYCDPPYAPLQQDTNFTQYAGGGFSLEQQKRLADLAREIDSPVLISNHDTEFTRKIYQGAKFKTLQVNRSIGQKRESRGKVAELLALFT